MRVLFISAAVLACATAAPSGDLLSIAATVDPVIPSALPTISPGDIQAAAIDAKVAIEDQARIIADQAILLADQVKEQAELVADEQTTKINEANDLIQEKNEEALWAAEEQKWQALDTVNTAEAQVDGSVASNAPALARSIGGVIIPAPVFAQFVSPIISPIVYAAPGIVAPLPKAVAKPETKPDGEKTEEEKVQTERSETPIEKAVEVSTEEAVSTEKPAEPTTSEEKPSEVPQNAAIVAFSQSYRFTDPWPLSPITYFQTGVHPLAAIRQIPGPIPYPQTIVATQWK